MALVVKAGPRTWSGDRDDAGHRTYNVVHLVRCTAGEGPAAIFASPLLPQPGTVWDFTHPVLGGDDYDPWAWCTPYMKVSIHQEKEGDVPEWYRVEQRFSTAPPPPSASRCNDTPVEDPLLEPPAVSGSFVKGKIEATRDRFDLPIITSSHEMIRGAQNEWDKSKPNLRISQNVADLELPLLVSMIDTLNAFTIWGLPPRCVKLSNVSWEKKYYGDCLVYYTRELEFDVDWKTFDRDLLDEGTKALRGHWGATTGEWVLDPVYATIIPLEMFYGDPLNPNHFDRYKDRNGENTRVVLDGAGIPFNPNVDRTLGCSECPTGAPTTWSAEGFDDEEEQMIYISDCDWAGANIQLSYAAGVWKLTHNDYALHEWTLNTTDEDWNCMGPNVLVRTAGATGPAAVQITRVETEPGKVHVEFYGESDFLLLDVPTTF